MHFNTRMNKLHILCNVKFKGDLVFSVRLSVRICCGDVTMV